MYRCAGGYVHHEYATVKSVFFSLVRNVDRTATWCCECHSVVSSKHSDPPRTTHAWLFRRSTTQHLQLIGLPCVWLTWAPGSKPVVFVWTLPRRSSCGWVLSRCSPGLTLMRCLSCRQLFQFSSRHATWRGDLQSTVAVRTSRFCLPERLLSAATTASSRPLLVDACHQDDGPDVFPMLYPSIISIYN